MQFTAASLALLGLASTAAAQRTFGVGRNTTNPNGATVLNIITTSSSNKIQLLPINGTDSGFYIGGAAVKTACPADEAKEAGFDCSQTKEYTELIANVDQTIGLNVAVPGGQLIYVANDGAVTYLKAHSPLPVGSKTKFTFVPGSEEGIVGRIEGPNGASFVACPVAGNKDTYKIYDSKSQGFAFPSESCITMGWGAIAALNQTTAAYEYE